jgi:hypothetical protein
MAPNSVVNSPMAGPSRTIAKAGTGRRRVDGKSFRLVDEVRYIQQRATAADAHIVSLGQLVLFSAQTGARQSRWSAGCRSRLGSTSRYYRRRKLRWWYRKR